MNDIVVAIVRMVSKPARGIKRSLESFVRIHPAAALPFTQSWERTTDEASRWRLYPNRKTSGAHHKNRGKRKENTKTKDRRTHTRLVICFTVELNAGPLFLSKETEGLKSLKFPNQNSWTPRREQHKFMYPHMFKSTTNYRSLSLSLTVWMRNEVRDLIRSTGLENQQQQHFGVIVKLGRQTHSNDTRD
jgi:hypothetical protein